MNCPDCWKEVRSRNDILAAVKENAKELAHKEQKPVAILQEGPGFSYTTFTGAPPGGTIDIIIPSQ